MFEIELCWGDEEIPEGYSWTDISYIEVPALPPEGTIVRLERVIHDFPFRKTEQFEVEVIGETTLDFVNDKWEYTVYVRLVDSE